MVKGRAQAASAEQQGTVAFTAKSPAQTLALVQPEGGKQWIFTF